MMRVLLADDDDDLLAELRNHLRDVGFDVLPFRDGRELRDWLLRMSPHDQPDVVVTDLRMPGWSGLDVLRWLGLNHPEIPVVLVTGYGDEHTRERARQLGAFAVCDKPVTALQLENVVLAISRARAATEELRGKTPQS